MSMNILQLKNLYKVSAVLAHDNAKMAAAVRKKKRDPLRAAYPDYGKSLVAQTKRNPVVAGVSRGAKTGLTGGILAAVIARLLTDNPKIVGGAGAAGAAVGGTAGYVSGSREAESEHSRNLALRRLGINNPAELFVLNRAPELTKHVTGEGVYL